MQFQNTIPTYSGNDNIISLRMSHAAVITRDVFPCQLLTVAQAYFVLAVKFGIKTFPNILCGLLISEILYKISEQRLYVFSWNMRIDTSADCRIHTCQDQARCPFWY